MKEGQLAFNAPNLREYAPVTTGQKVFLSATRLVQLRRDRVGFPTAMLPKACKAGRAIQVPKAVSIVCLPRRVGVYRENKV